MFDVVYYCDSNAIIGNGHLNRGVETLNCILSNRPTLKVAISGNLEKEAKYFADSLANPKIKIIPKRTPLNSRLAVLDTMFKAGNAEYVDFKICDALKESTGKLVVVAYGIETKVPWSVDGVINHVPGARVTSGKKEIKLWIGIEYAPVHSSFYALKRNTNKYYMLCILGSAVKKGFIIHFLKEIRKLSSEWKISILLSPYYESSITDLKKAAGDGIAIYTKVDSVARLVEKHGLIISTYGNSAYEALASGRPVILISAHKFQERYSKLLHKMKIAAYAGYIGKFRVDEFKENILNASSDMGIYGTKAKKVMRGIEKCAKVLIAELENA